MQHLMLEPCLMLLRRWFFTIREPVAGFRLSCRKKGSYQEENGYDQLIAKDVLIFLFLTAIGEVEVIKNKNGFENHLALHQMSLRRNSLDGALLLSPFMGMQLKFAV